MSPVMTKWPPRARMMSEAMFAMMPTVGMTTENIFSICRPVFRDSVLRAENFAFSSRAESKTRTSADPRMLSLMVKFSLSTMSCALVKSGPRRLKTRANTKPIEGRMARTARASFQSMSRRSTAEPTMSTTFEMRMTMACDTNALIASMSEVRLVRSFEGVSLSRREKLNPAIFPASLSRRSRATFSLA